MIGKSVYRDLSRNISLTVFFRKLSPMAVSLLICICGQELLAQSTGTLSGYVRDARSGEPLVGANVGIEGTARGAGTDSEGFYEIANIPVGNYTVIASYIGYETQSRINVSVRTAGTRDLNFELQPAASELEEVVVTFAEPFRRPPENPISYQSLSPEEIATYPAGNSDIAKVVQSLPGVSGSVSGFRNDVIIRGGAPNENVYYLDDIEIPAINHFSTQGSAGGPAGLLNVAFFDGVDLSTSAFGARYGNALSGVLQFNQRRGNDREFRTNIRVGASEAALTAEGPLFRGERSSSNTTFIASVRRSYLQLLFRLIDLPFLPDYWDYQYRLTHRLDASNEIYLTGVGSIDDFRINVPSETSPDQQAVLEQVPVIRQNSNTTGIAWRNRFNGGDGLLVTSLSTSLFGNDFLRYRDNVEQDGLFFRNRSSEWRNTLRSEVRLFGDQTTFNAGGQLRLNRFRNDFTDLNRGVEFDADILFLSYGLFGQLTWERPGHPLRVTAGLRTDGNTFMDRGNEIYRTLSPRIAASYRLDGSDRWRVNASAGRYFKKPPLTLLGYRQAGRYVNRWDSRYIRSDHLTAGVEFFPRASSRLALESFLKLYDNYPVSLEKGVSLANLGADFEVLGNENVESVGKGRTYGLEFVFQQKFETSYYAILAYTLFWSEFTGPDGTFFLPSRWDSRHLLTFTGGYRVGDRWEFSLRSRFVGRTPFAPVNLETSLQTYPVFLFEFDRLGESRLQPFSATDIRIDRKWDFSRAGISLDLYLEIQNLFGQNTPSEPRYLLRNGEQPSLERVDQLRESSILPTIGLIVDF